MPTPFQQLCAEYLSELRSQRANPQSTGELSLRAALDQLLQGARKVANSDATFTGEGKKIAEGRPDFVVATSGVPVGYIEAEKYGLDLDKLAGHAKEQNERFIQNLDHFLLTNHLDFRLYHVGKMVAEVSLPAPPEKGAPVVAEDKAEKLLAILEQLMSAERPALASPRELAFHLSRRARQMNAAVLETLENPEAEIHNDFAAFQSVLLPNLTRAEFADLYAQTFAYGLFAARCNFVGSEKFTRRVAGDFLSTNPFLKKLFARFAGELDANLVWIADDMAALLNGAKIGDIREYFFARTGNADPMIDFYEPFLRAYDAGLRDLRGVYYTPQPVVKYIVNSVHHLLQTHFKKARGLADESTLILDPATGTGSFLFAVIDRIHEEVEKAGSGLWGAYVEEHLLHRVFGFELMIAPYTIAHLKLGLQLVGQGASVAEGARFNVFLTNTLDAAVQKGDVPLSEWLSNEANGTVKVKNDEPILVVLGNPPYSGHSANKSDLVKELAVGAMYSVTRKGGYITTHVAKTGRNKHEKTWIGQLIENYKRVDGAPLGEKNPKWLQDDYVKFIAFAQERIRKTGEGVVGFITNHGYLDNPTFRGMRQSLMQTFTEIYVLDLHGNSKKKEKAPDGAADQNVFEIQQGVAILLAVKERGKDGPARVHHADLWGNQKSKYFDLERGDVSTTTWQEVEPTSPMYFFIPQNTDLLAEYSEGWKVTEIFPVNNIGLFTARDGFVYDFELKKLHDRLNRFLDSSTSNEETQTHFGLESLNVTNARTKLRSHADWKSLCHQGCYRPFDNRYLCYANELIERPRKDVMFHMLRGSNLGLIVGRGGAAVGDDEWNVLWVSNTIVDLNIFRRGGGQLHPLYLYPDQSTLGFETARRPNLSAAFLKVLCERLQLPPEGEHGLPRGVSPEDVFHYAYAIFHAPAYRARYAQFLKTDFPRLPLTSDVPLFRDLAQHGAQLVALHLLDTKAAPVLNEARHRFEGSGSRTVEKVEYFENARQVKIHAAQWFENVPRDVWEFRIGGYQVADKWLKDRKGRALGFDDITHYARTLIAIAETIRVMQEIEARIPAWPLT